MCELGAHTRLRGKEAWKTPVEFDSLPIHQVHGKAQANGSNQQQGEMRPQSCMEAIGMTRFVEMDDTCVSNLMAMKRDDPHAEPGQQQHKRF